MCNKEQLIAYLYDELSDADRVRFDAHAAACAECRGDLAQLRLTRQHLAAWAPPEPALDFRIVRGRSTRPVPGFRFVPAWGLAAAASVLLLAGAAALANLEVRYGADGLVVRTGWGAGLPAGVEVAGLAPAAPPAAGDAPSSEQWKEAVVALERRLQTLEAADRGGTADGLARTVTDQQLTAMTAAMRRLIAESEARQRTERTAQIDQVWKDFNAARASDFVRVHETLGRVQGLTNYHLRQQQNSIESLYRVSLQK